MSRYFVAEGAKLVCSMGTENPALKLTKRKHTCEKKEIANVEDRKPIQDIPSFGMCRSMANPQVQAATQAAQGVLTPQPCEPPSFSVWTPGAKFIFQIVGGTKIKVLTSDSQCVCAFAGIVKITQPNTHAKVDDSPGSPSQQGGNYPGETGD